MARAELKKGLATRPSIHPFHMHMVWLVRAVCASEMFLFHSLCHRFAFACMPAARLVDFAIAFCSRLENQNSILSFHCTFSDSHHILAVNCRCASFLRVKRSPVGTVCGVFRLTQIRGYRCCRPFGPNEQNHARCPHTCTNTSDPVRIGFSG